MNGSELKDLRNRARLTQKDVAEKIGFLYQSYQRYENCKDNEVNINPQYYKTLGDLYNLPVGAFIPRSSGGNTAVPDNGSTSIAAAGDMSNTATAGRKLTALEEQVLSLKTLYDPKELLLNEYAEKLLKIKRIHES